MNATTRILYVDDDAATRRLVERDLTRHGFRLTMAETGREGETLIREACHDGASEYDVICLDHYMPEQDGLETLQRLSGLPGLPPIIFVTGSEEGRLAVAALRAGATSYVIKEATGEYIHLLRATVSDVLEREQLRHAKDQALYELKLARDRAQELAEQRAVLLREVNHRVANSLQLITSLISLRERTCKDEASKNALAEIRHRIFALGQIHRRLYTIEDVRLVAVNEYLGGLLGELKRSIIDEVESVALNFDIAELLLPTDRAVSLGVIVAELVTNAMKYAYPSGEGIVHVRFSLDDDHAVLQVEDRGVGYAHDAPIGTGLGRAVIAAMAESLGAKLTHSDNQPGLKVLVRFPLELSCADEA